MSIIDTLKKTVRGKQADAQDNDILDTLKQEHDDVAELLDQLVESTSAAQRKKLLTSIKVALVPHLRAEEKVVYDAVLALKGKERQTHGEEGYMEHALGDKMLAQLGKIANAMSPEFSAAAKVLKELVEHHVEEEEKNIWSDVEAAFSDEDRIAMNKKFLAAKKRVRVPA
ncbi:MAG: hemerythrin domain-containing protein [Alphaproteobacteria bacterium]|nr:hemerythrin domain-containing protein [Alphaproteobacteria bacterium]